LPCIFTWSRDSWQPAEAAYNDSIIYFTLTRVQQRVVNTLSLWGECTLNIEFEPEKEEWAAPAEMEV
jgi:hypothetical protein